MEKAYRIFSKIDAPKESYEDVFSPKTIYTLIQAGEQRIRVSLPVRSDWDVGDIVKIEEAVVLANIIE